MGVLLAEHRLERCLAAADRVVASTRGRSPSTARPRAYCEWALAADPELAPPGARLFSLAGLAPPPVSVKEARAAARAPAGSSRAAAPARRRPSRPSGARRAARRGARRSRDLWVELDVGIGPREVLRGLELAVEPGELVALMGRNGAGKSTLLRAAAGLVEPVRGSVGRAAAAARCCRRARPTCWSASGSARSCRASAGRRRWPRSASSGPPTRDPRDLSGGERERLALAIVMAGRADGELPGLICLDEPTRGMDAAPQARALRLAARARRGAARRSLVATHDVEFAARLASRVVLLGDGELIADGPADEILSGGWYFATEVARILGARGALTPEQGAELLREDARPAPGVRCRRDELAGRRPSPGSALVLVGGFWWYERSRPSARLVALVAALAALAVAGRLVLAPIPNVVATTDIALITGYALGAGPGFAVGALAAPISNIWLGQGPWTAWQMAGWGLVGLGGAWLATRHPTAARAARAGDRLRRSPASPTAPCSTSR